MVYGTSWTRKFVFIRFLHVFSLPCTCLPSPLLARLSEFQIAASQSHSRCFHREVLTVVPQKNCILWALLVLRDVVVKTVFCCLEKKPDDRSIHLLDSRQYTTSLSHYFMVLHLKEQFCLHRSKICQLSVFIFRCNLFLNKFKGRHLYHTYFGLSIIWFF